MTRRAGRIDANQAAIVRALRQMGASVQSLASVGDGVPDLLIGYKGVNLLAEVKDGNAEPSRRRLTEAERDWHCLWHGQVCVLESVEEAIHLLEKL